METVLEYILNNWWAVEVVNLMICILTVLYVDGCKKIICKIASKKGKTVDLGKWEYVISLVSFTLTFGVVLGFLLTIGYDFYRSAVEGAFFGFGTGGVYQLIAQPSRKGLKKLLNFVINLFSKVKKGTANETIKEDIKELLDTSTDTADIVEEVKDTVTTESAPQNAMDSLTSLVESLKN